MLVSLGNVDENAYYVFNTETGSYEIAEEPDLGVNVNVAMKAEDLDISLNSYKGMESSSFYSFIRENLDDSGINLVKWISDMYFHGTPDNITLLEYEDTVLVTDFVLALYCKRSALDFFKDKNRIKKNMLYKGYNIIHDCVDVTSDTDIELRSGVTYRFCDDCLVDTVTVLSDNLTLDYSLCKRLTIRNLYLKVDNVLFLKELLDKCDVVFKLHCSSEVVESIGLRQRKVDEICLLDNKKLNSIVPEEVRKDIARFKPIEYRCKHFNEFKFMQSNKQFFDANKYHLDYNAQAIGEIIVGMLPTSVNNASYTLGQFSPIVYDFALDTEIRFKLREYLTKNVFSKINDLEILYRNYQLTPFSHITVSVGLTDKLIVKLLTCSNIFNYIYDADKKVSHIRNLNMKDFDRLIDVINYCLEDPNRSWLKHQVKYVEYIGDMAIVLYDGKERKNIDNEYVRYVRV